jgi:hypothetical protein
LILLPDSELSKIHALLQQHVIPARYISIRIPSVSENENHPFSIASAPGDEELQVVIKVVGDWTGELRRQVENGTVCPGVMVAVFGPYGAPAQSVFKYRSVILVCGGIGVTPFASILQFFNSNLQHDSESFDHTNPRHGQTPGRYRSLTVADHVHHANILTSLQHGARTEDVQFIWVCSDLSSISWFTNVLKGPFSCLSAHCFPTFPTRHLQPFFLQIYTSTKKAKSAPFASKYTSHPSQASAWTLWHFTSPVACSLMLADMTLSVVSLSFVAAVDRIGLTYSRRPQSKTTPSSDTQHAHTTHSARVRLLSPVDALANSSLLLFANGFLTRR